MECKATKIVQEKNKQKYRTTKQIHYKCTCYVKINKDKNVSLDIAHKDLIQSHKTIVSIKLFSDPHNVSL